MCCETGADLVVFHYEYTPEGDFREAQLRKAMETIGVACHGFPGYLLYDVRYIHTQRGFVNGH